MIKTNLSGFVVPIICTWACANSTSNPSGYTLGIWLPVSHAPSCIGTTNPSRTGLNPLSNIHKYCCYTKHGGIKTNLTLIRVNGAWIKRYSILCSKTYNTLHSCHNFPVGLRQATMGARICETSLFPPLVSAEHVLVVTELDYTRARERVLLARWCRPAGSPEIAWCF